MNYLGIDFGKKHVGVALATGLLAEPLTTLNTKTAIKVIKELIVIHKIDTIIIGNPGESLSLEFEKFVNSLKIVPQKRDPAEAVKNCKLEIVDETLSSHDARQLLLHTTQKRRQELEHAAAASIILQSWLDYYG